MTGLGGQDWGGIDPPNPVITAYRCFELCDVTKLGVYDRIGGVDTPPILTPQSCHHRSPLF